LRGEIVNGGHRSGEFTDDARVKTLAIIVNLLDVPLDEFGESSLIVFLAGNKLLIEFVAADFIN